ncbi:MAG: TIGR01212 family radical SAM protein [Spirochaetota bacterium]
MESQTREPLRRYSNWLQERYGAKTYRVSVDAGFTCPVRDAGTPCAYCDAAGSRAPYLGDEAAIGEQIARGVAFASARYHARKFLLYFQAFSNTHAPVDELRRVYDLALAQSQFVGLIVATRPDCIDEERAKLLAEYAERGLDVWVELGLQSANDATLRRIGRGHTREQFDEAVRALSEYDINIAAHLILGLPGEGVDDAIASARHVSSLPIAGVKFHNLVVVAGTPLYRQYRRGEIAPPTSGEYRELLVAALEYLRPDIIVMRITCDPPKGVAYAPEIRPDKVGLFEDIVDEFRKRGTRQGIYWRQDADQRRRDS